MHDEVSRAGLPCVETGAGGGRDSGSPAPDSLGEQRLARLASFRQPSVEEIEEKLFLEEYLRRRNSGAVKLRAAKHLQPLPRE